MPPDADADVHDDDSDYPKDGRSSPRRPSTIDFMIKALHIGSPNPSSIAPESLSSPVSSRLSILDSLCCSVLSPALFLLFFVAMQHRFGASYTMLLPFFSSLWREWYTSVSVRNDKKRTPARASRSLHPLRLISPLFVRVCLLD